MEAIPPIPVRHYGTSGAPVAVLHGGPGVPGYLAPVARHLGATYRVIEPLQRLAGTVPLSVARHVQDLAEVAPSRVHIVGASWGAMLALSYASVHPERVASLCLVGCGTYDAVARREFQRRTAARLGREGCAQITQLQRDLTAATDNAGRSACFAAMGRLATEAQSVDVLPETDAPVAHDPQGFEETWEDVLRLQREGIEPARFTAIRVPVLMLHGTEDPHPGEMVRERLAPLLPQLRYQGFARCGHEPWRERHAKTAFFEALDAWLEEVVAVDPGATST